MGRDIMQMNTGSTSRYPSTCPCKGIKSFVFCTVLSILFLFLAVPFAFAGERMKPLWEAGLAGIGGYVPDYPSSDENRADGIILPYLIYRGEIFRAGDKGIARGRILRSERAEFDLSLDGSFDTESDDNIARKGMPDLDYLFELGPRLQITLTDHFLTGKVDLEIPARGVIATDFSSLSLEGIVFQPQIAWQHYDLFGTGTKFKISAGPIFATEDFMDYFFEVQPRYATPERAAFDARGGYLGSEITLAGIRDIRDFLSVIGDFKIGYYRGSANDDSPLFRDDVTLSVRIGLLWRPFRSKRTVRE
jgi:outer membrane protein